MSFVPIVVPPPPPSARTTELHSRLTTTIDRFRQENPTVSSAEIKQAVHLVLNGAGRGIPGLAGALAAMFLIFGALVFLYLARGGLDFGGQPLILMTVVGTGVVALAIVAATLKSRH